MDNKKNDYQLEKEVDQIYKEKCDMEKRCAEANEQIKSLGKGSSAVLLSIDAATTEINILLKDLFICAQADLREYELIYLKLIESLTSITYCAQTKFGKIKVHPQNTH